MRDDYCKSFAVQDGRMNMTTYTDLYATNIGYSPPPSPRKKILTLYTEKEKYSPPPKKERKKQGSEQVKGKVTAQSKLSGGDKKKKKKKKKERRVNQTVLKMKSNSSYKQQNGQNSHEFNSSVLGNDNN